MPELPEVETVRRTLQTLINGKTIQNIDVFYDKIVQNRSINEFQQLLINQTINDIGRRGKYLLFDLGEYTLISHLRMEGKYFIKNLLEAKDKHEHVIFYFTDDTTLRYHDVRKFGTMDLVKTSEVHDVDPLQKLAPEPMDKAWKRSYLSRKLANKTIAIKTALLDQTIVAGLGNIYVNEVLFLSKINPERPANKLKEAELKRIVHYSKEVLEKAIEQGGTTIRSYTSSLGVTGRFQHELYVHGREGESCKVCGTRVEKKKVNGRGTYYCQKCQK